MVSQYIQYRYYAFDVSLGFNFFIVCMLCESSLWLPNSNKLYVGLCVWHIRSTVSDSVKPSPKGEGSRLALSPPINMPLYSDIEKAVAMNPMIFFVWLFYVNSAFILWIGPTEIQLIRATQVTQHHCYQCYILITADTMTSYRSGYVTLERH